MKLKFIPPPPVEYDKERLYRIALRIAIEELVIGPDYRDVKHARASIIYKAKKEYSKLK